MRKAKIFTHYSLDLDACFAVLAAIMYFFKENLNTFFKDPKWRDRISLVPADWDGSDMEEGDIAVDLEANGKGKKGAIEQGKRVDSATLQVLEEYAPIQDQIALQNFVHYLNEHDATRNALKSIIGNEEGYKKDLIDICKAGTIEEAFKAVKTGIGYGDPKGVIKHYSVEFKGYLENGKKYLRAHQAYGERAQFYDKKKNIVFLNTENVPLEICNIAFEKGAEVIIYKNKDDVGIWRRDFSEFPTNHPIIMELIQKAGEEELWYFHPAHFLACTGSCKKRATFKTKIRIDQLLFVVNKAFKEFQISLIKKEKI